MGVLGGLIEKKLPLVLLNPLVLSGDTWEDCHWGPVSFPGSEVPTSQAQLQKSTPETDCLQRQLDQCFDCGDSKAMLGLSSTIWDLTSNSDSGNQGPLFLGKTDKGPCAGHHKAVGGGGRGPLPRPLLAQLKLLTL